MSAVIGGRFIDQPHRKCFTDLNRAVKPNDSPSTHCAQKGDSMTDSTSSKNQQVDLSRRQLFRTAAVAAGGAVLLGWPKLVGRWVGEADAAMQTMVASTPLLELEGVVVCSLRSAEGGNAFAEVLLEPPGPDLIARKRPGPPRFEDLVISFSPSGDTKSLNTWIVDMLTKAPASRNGAVVYVDMNFNVVKRLEFSNASLSEVMLPKIEATDSNTLAITLRLTPQSTHLAGGGGKMPSLLSNKIKNLRVSQYRFTVQGLEAACGRVSKIESLTARRGAPSVPSGQDKFRQALPAGNVLDCSLVSITLPEPDAGPFYAWFDDLVLKGNQSAERAGLLEWLDPTGKPSCSVQLGGLGIVRYAPSPIRPDAGMKSPLVQVDMYCQTMNLLM